MTDKEQPEQTPEQTEAKARRRDTRGFRTSMTMLVGFIVISSFNLLYTNHSLRESNGYWCDLITSLDDRQQGLRTSDPDAIEFIRDVHNLRRKLPCPPPPSPTQKESP